MIAQTIPPDQVFWYLNHLKPRRLKSGKSYDVVVVGGGMAGISAAQSFALKGLKVALLEKTFCGAGATGKSSGFITTDSEVTLGKFISMYGVEKAREIWNFGDGGTSLIKNNIQRYSLECDYQPHNTLVVANSNKAFKTDIKQEYCDRLKMGFDTSLYSKDQLSAVINADDYYGGLQYAGTFGISGFLYCQEMKRVLNEYNVDVFEETPVIDIKDHTVFTPDAQVKSEYIVLCVDRFLPEFSRLSDKIFHVQNFVAASSPLTDAQIQYMFPQGPCMTWDTDLVYTFYRITKDNRLLIGGGNIFSAYVSREHYHKHSVVKQLYKYIETKFPKTSITLEYFWPGLIGITKDVVPLAGVDKDQSHIYYISGAAGLPWAAALGQYSAQRLIDNNQSFDDYFSPYRSFPIGSFIQSIIGKRATFALSNYFTIG